uniref:Putative secreted protein n=1 Tax=Anopheles darlingi TaxID=43151 RepID=A0A2M4DCE7_ANODA
MIRLLVSLVLPHRFRCLSGLVHEALIVRMDFARGNVQTELQRYQYGKLRCNQLLTVQTEHTFRFLNQALQRFALDVVQLGAQQKTGAGAQLPVFLVHQLRQDKLLEVHVCLRDGQKIDATVQLVDTLHFTLNASELAER